MLNMNDNVKPFAIIDERDLHAYVDGLLDDQHAKRVEEYLNRHPNKLHEVEDYIKYNHLLKDIFREDSREIPQRLLMTLNHQPKEIWPVIRKTAAIIVLCALCAGGGWFGADLSSNYEEGAQSDYEQTAVLDNPISSPTVTNDLNHNSASQTATINNDPIIQDAQINGTEQLIPSNDIITEPTQNDPDSPYNILPYESLGISTES